RIIDLQILEENASKLQNYCYDEKNFKVPVIEQVLDVSGLGAALPPTIQRIAGSGRRRSASFTSLYPARRPNTDCRNNPATACRPSLPLRASPRTSSAISVKPSTSSSSR